jgi:hypothetical protein
MLPLFGAPLSIGIATGPGGALTEVTVTPADNTTADKLRPHKVVFTSADPNDASSTAKVVIRSRKGGISVSAKAGSLDAFTTAAGGWSGDIFGDGTATSVPFTIVKLPDGTPDIALGVPSGLVGVAGEVQHSTETGDDGETESSARVSIVFTNADGDQSRTLTIKVKVETDADASTEAKLSISLGRLKGVAVPASDAAGHHTWSGVLCDNSPATIEYDVALDGSVSNVVPSPDAEVKGNDSKIDVRFSHDERVRIKVRADDDMIKISVDERIRCDSADPTTNVAASPGDDDDDANEDANEHKGGRHGGHDDDDDTTTSTAAPVAP